ncbi:acyltransferase family protein [Hymenobacter baengnokdamensis]|uniref:acyltransferase family protein n=1 Tax=Hymenobacter baengnokdamensis TaxID=2615203 RepID=UPI0017857A52|nr:acyltransferase [Hymenobacter baengnokdamensis]
MSELLTANGQAVHKRYLPGLDSLRAIAALSVCLFHFTNGALPKAIVPVVKQTFSKGALGVDIFFVISGFIIPYSLLGKNYQLSGFLVYIKKRIIRINPPAYVAIILVLAQWFIIDQFIRHTTSYTSGLSAGQIISNLLFVVPFTSYKWVIGVFWTLAIEFEFYLFIGILFSFLFERRHIGFFIGCYLLVNALQYVVPVLAVGSFCQYSTIFALGGATLLWQQKRLTLLLYAGCLLLFSGLAYWQLGAYVAGTALATAIVINLMNVNIPGLGFIGKISYSFYLLHVFIGNTSEFILVKLIAPTSDAHKLLILALSLIAAVTGAYIFYRLVEQPFMRLASRQH